MNRKSSAKNLAPKTQEICIDLPGESVQCWRSGDHVTVILRKHRDVFFDITMHPGSVYTVESTKDFYSPREKKLLRRAEFRDGERFHLWIGRNFTGSLLLKSDGKVIGSYEANKLDPKIYDADPTKKPEPLMVIMGKTESHAIPYRSVDSQLSKFNAQGILKPIFDPKISFLKDYGTEFDYQYAQQQPVIKEYACVTDAISSEIQAQVINQLDSGVVVEGTISQIFVPPKGGQEKSDLYVAMAVAAGNLFGGVADNNILTANWFKESAGYVQEHWRSLDKLAMKVRIEKRVIGKYRVIFKGRLLSTVIPKALGMASTAAVVHKAGALGSAKSAFLDGGFGRTGKAGYGSVKRMMLTSAENFRGGVKIQIIGTVIDIVGDVNTVYFSEKGSKDFSEFLGRSGISILKAGATAAIGGVVSAVLTAGAISLLGASALPVVVAVALVVAGYILAATLVDLVDDQLSIKNNVADWAK